MISVLNEVTSLRGGLPLAIDHKNSNRYCVLLFEQDGSKTAYYFSSPIYNENTRRVVDFKFWQRNNSVVSTGSNAEIEISAGIRLKNNEGYCVANIKGEPMFMDEYKTRLGNAVVSRTTNGVVCRVCCKQGPIAFDVETDRPFMEVRANEKSFVLLREPFRPFVTISSVGTANDAGEIIAPAMITYQKIQDQKFKITVDRCSAMGEFVVFEINLYEQKLFQDTTVESRKPSVNNAFGTVAFLGSTVRFGEQWLYSRLDYAKIPELADKRINKATVHLPMHNQVDAQLSAFKVAARFCSFGSNWNNKVAASSVVSEVSFDRKYQHVDITDMLAQPRNGHTMRSEGIILKSKTRGCGFSVIATGDSCFTPQILEVNYK